MWHKLHSRILCQLPSFKKSHIAYKKKFNSLFTMYKEDKMSNGIYWESHHECKYYEEFDTRWLQASSVMKHVFVIAYVFELGRDDEKLVDNEVEESSDLNPSKSPLEKSTTNPHFRSKHWFFFQRW